MADSGGGGDGSNQGSRIFSAEEKVNKYKRKSLNQSLDVSMDLSRSTPAELPRYELSLEKFPKSGTGSEVSEASSDEPEEEDETEVFESSEWDDPTATKLEELLSNNVLATFQSAIKRLVGCGYTEKSAEEAVLRNGIFYGKDPVLNTVECALLYLARDTEFDTPRSDAITDLQNLVQYTVLEMVCVLREVKPSLTVSDALWWLLMSDLNLSSACAMNFNILGGFGGKELASESSSPHTLFGGDQNLESFLPNSNKPNIFEPSICSAHNSRCKVPKSPNLKNLLIHGTKKLEKEGSSPPVLDDLKTLDKTEEAVPQMLAMEEEKHGGCRKGHSSNSKRDMLRQKSLHYEKTYKGGSKGSFKGKLTSLNNLVLDKKIKPQSDSSVITLKKTLSLMRTTATDKPIPLPSKETFSAFTAAHSQISQALLQEIKHFPKLQTGIPNPPTSPYNYYAKIPYDKSLGRYVPRDDKDEKLLQLLPMLQELQQQVQSWTNWANEKVRQVAQRLGREQKELKMLRKDKEDVGNSEKDKQILEDSTSKRLSEMEYAIATATAQIEMANATARRLEADSALLKKQMEASRHEALKSATNLQEALRREQEALKTALSWDAEKSQLLEEIASHKRKVEELQKEVKKANGAYNQIQGLLKQEESEKEQLILQATSIKKDREQLKALQNAEEYVMRQEADQEKRKYKEDIEKMESELSELRLKSESSRIAALKRGVTDRKSAGAVPTMEGYHNPDISMGLEFVEASLRRNRECVMCLMDEIAVVFLPCAHQVVCVACNEKHKKQGMNDCPSCRTPIQRRINVHYATSPNSVQGR